jgi:TonB family protein
MAADMPWAWASLFLRSAVILGAAELLCRFPGKRDPVYRHRIVLVAFGLLLVWPLFSAVIPEINLPLWPHLPMHGTVTVQTTIIPGRSTPAPQVFNWPVLIWATGVFLALAPVLIGYLNVLRMARRAVPLADDRWNALLEDLCGQLNIKRKPALLIFPEPVMALTFGLRQPRILLPVDCLKWTPSRQRSVLLHELAHVQRHDVATQLFAHAMTALWWFQPLCWISRASLRRESERACDAIVLASGMRPSDYAMELLEIAQNFSAGHRWSSAAIMMARRGELEGRLNAILDPQPNRRTRRLSIAAIVVLILLTMTASAIDLLPKRQNNSPGGSFMKRTVLSGLLASAGLSAATIAGSLVDPSGATVTNAKALLYNPDTAVKQETTTASDGKFAFDNLPAGQYILRIEKPGFAALFREFSVQPDSRVERGLTLKLGAVEEQVNVQAKGEAVASTQSPGAKPIRIGGAVQAANLIRKVQPVYPASAKAAGIQGAVLLDMVVSTDGVPEDIRVISSPSDDLTQSALDAVRQWRYQATHLNGMPVEIATEVTVNYTLSQ